MRNIRQRYSCKTVSGSKDRVNIAISFDRAVEPSAIRSFKLHSLF